MARTRGTSNVIHTDDGELVDKEGKPIPLSGMATWSGVTQQPNPDALPPVELELEPGPEPVPMRYRCDEATVGRDMSGWEAFRLMRVLLGELSAEVSDEEFGQMPADVRRHFRRIV